MQKNIPLRDKNTFRTGGNARYFFRAANVDQLIESLSFAKDKKLAHFILGGGSNVLIGDAGFDGVVIRMENADVSIDEKDGRALVTSGAGKNWDELVAETVEMGLCGLENLSYIPGSVGAAAVGNIGAYGVEVKDSIDSVTALDVSTNELKEFSNADCAFSYRDSFFKSGEGKNFVIVSVTFSLSKEGPLKTSYKGLAAYFEAKKVTPTQSDVREAVIAIRKAKLPDIKEFGTAGSFFKNPIVPKEKYEALLAQFPEMPKYDVDDQRVKIPAAWILDNVCNFKGHREGEVGVYKNQALVIVNYGNATSAQIKALAEKMKNSVFQKTGIELEREVEYVAVD